MNPLVLYFVSGDSLYAGWGFLFLAVVTPNHLGRPWLLFRNFAAWMGLALMAMACPPFSWPVDLLFLVIFSFWLIAANRRLGWLGTGSRRGLAVLLLFLVSLLTISEFRHRRIPKISGGVANHLVVIGDSISSGIDPRIPAWPAVMQQLTGVPVLNLARPGAEVAEGIDMAKGVTADDHLVLIEVGGNDLLNNNSSESFEKNLEAILSTLRAPRRTLVMLELPLLPHEVAYGRIQRRLAEKYNVWLIPKRCFTEVLSGADATFDGLHLSRRGTQRMAALVASVLSPVLKGPKANAGGG